MFIYGFLLTLVGIVSLFLIFFYSKLRPSSTRGFWNVSDPKKVSFIPLNPDDDDIISWGIKHKLFKEPPKALKRFNLYQGERGVFVEDRNYNEGCLKNRKRIRKHKTNLNHQDVLDFDNFTLIYHDDASAKFALRKIKRSFKNNSFSTKGLLFNPKLQPNDERKEPFLLNKNVVYIGRSQINDIVLRHPNISRYQAKILLNAGRAKLIDVSDDFNTFVNGKRVNERYLSHKDEVAFDNHKFKFLQK